MKNSNNHKLKLIDPSYISHKTKPFISMLTYNILFPAKVPIIKQLQNHTARYKYQLQKLLPELGADILCLQEITEDYVEFLNNNNELGSNYKWTGPPTIRAEFHYPIIITNLPFVELFNQNRKVIIYTKKNEIDLIIISCHYYHVESATNIREDNIREVEEFLSTIIIKDDFTENNSLIKKSLEGNQISKKELISGVKVALENSNIFMLGDFNFHFPKENSVLEDMLYHDLWLERHSHFEGLTWDSELNSMTAYVPPFENRRLRLDRIICKKSNNLDLLSIELFGNKQLDRFWLFPSDHFGIKAEFVLNDKGLIIKDNEHKKEFKRIIQDSHGYRTEQEIKLYRIIGISIIVLILLFFMYKIVRLIFTKKAHTN